MIAGYSVPHLLRYEPEVDTFESLQVPLQVGPKMIVKDGRTLYVLGRNEIVEHSGTDVQIHTKESPFFEYVNGEGLYTHGKICFMSSPLIICYFDLETKRVHR